MPYDDLRKGRISCGGHAYSVTAVTMDRTPYFSDFLLGRIAVWEMKRLHDEQRLESIAWVLMPDHLHWMFQLGDGQELAAVMKDFKARSARRINEALGRLGTIWQREYYDHAIRKDEDLRSLARYIVANPLRAGLVSEIGDYPLWDAVWL